MRPSASMRSNALAGSPRWREHRDRVPVLGDFEGLAGADPLQVHAEVLPQLPDADLLHDAHGSTIAVLDVHGPRGSPWSRRASFHVRNR